MQPARLTGMLLGLAVLLGCAQPLRFSERQPLILEEETTTAALVRRPLESNPSTPETAQPAIAPQVAASTPTSAPAAPQKVASQKESPQKPASQEASLSPESASTAVKSSDAAPPPASSPAPPPADAADAFSSVIAELESLGTLDATARERLIGDLRRTDPKLWPALIQYFKASVAIQRGDAASPAAEQVALPAEIDTPPEPEAAPGPVASSASRAPSTVQQTAWDTAVEEVDEPTQEQTTETSAPRTTSAASGSAQRRDPRLTGTLKPRKSAASGAKSKLGDRVRTEPSRLAANPSAVRLSTASADASPPEAVERAFHETPLPAENAAIEQQAWRAALAAAIASLEQDLVERPAAGEQDQRPVLLRLLHVMLGQKERALQPLEGMGAARQEFWTNELLGLEAWMSPAEGDDDGRRAALAARHLAHAASLLGETGLLVVRNLAFCTEIKDFGVYQRFDQYDFAPGQKVLLYAEVENFKSESTAQGFRTALASRCQVLDPQGGQIDDIDFPLTEEHCQSRRRDFFVPYVITLPTQMADGRHMLRLTIEDTLGRKVGQSTIEFMVKNRNRSRSESDDVQAPDGRTPADVAAEILKRSPNLSR